ncbi:hypothetical protein BFJ69_g18082, partial [Fusarium oxysporum]
MNEAYAAQNSSPQQGNQAQWAENHHREKRYEEMS